MDRHGRRLPLLHSLLFVPNKCTPLMDLTSKQNSLATDVTFTEAIRWTHGVESTSTSFCSSTGPNGQRAGNWYSEEEGSNQSADGCVQSLSTDSNVRSADILRCHGCG